MTVGTFSTAIDMPVSVALFQPTTPQRFRELPSFSTSSTLPFVVEVGIGRPQAVSGVARRRYRRHRRHRRNHLRRRRRLCRRLRRHRRRLKSLAKGVFSDCARADITFGRWHNAILICLRSPGNETPSFAEGEEKGGEGGEEKEEGGEEEEE